MANKKILRIKNFRSLEDVELEIRPLTFLFGTNGSGKSSVLKAIKFLGENTLPIRYQTKYTFREFNLGSYKELVTKNDTSKEILFEYIVLDKMFAEWVSDQISQYPGKKEEILLNYKQAIQNELASGKMFSAKFGEDLHGKNLHQFEFGYVNENETLDFYGYKFHYSNSDEPTIDFLTSNETIQNRPDVKEKFIQLIRHWGDKKNIYYRNWGDGHPDDPIVELGLDRFGSDLEDIHQKYLTEIYKDFFLDFNSSLLDFFPEEYLSTSRLKPKYRYFLNYGKFDSNEYYGLLNQFFENECLLNSLNEVLRKFDLAQKVEIEKAGEVGKIITFSQNGSKCNLAEANSGIQRSLPIIAFNELYSRTNFLLEQPEIELHPKLQCQLVEYLSTGKNNFIIETHSEHIIRKIQVILAQGKLKKEAVAVYYFDKDKETGITSIKEMELEENGFFKEPWPDGFFDDSYKLAQELIYARKN